MLLQLAKPIPQSVHPLLQLAKPISQSAHLLLRGAEPTPQSAHLLPRRAEVGGLAFDEQDLAEEAESFQCECLSAREKRLTFAWHHPKMRAEEMLQARVAGKSRGKGYTLLYI